jgi:hypothetical protein
MRIIGIGLLTAFLWQATTQSFVLGLVTKSSRSLCPEPRLWHWQHQEKRLKSRTSTRSILGMVPKFDKAAQKWIPTSADETAAAGYGKIKSLLLHGPYPFFQRVFQEDNYEQAVLKFMSSDKCGRIEAQGNMDAYLANPSDWAYNRIETEKSGGKKKPDYTVLDSKKLTLTLVWSTIVLSLAGRAIYSITTGEPFNLH